MNHTYKNIQTNSYIMSMLAVAQKQFYKLWENYEENNLIYSNYRFSKQNGRQIVIDIDYIINIIPWMKEVCHRLFPYGICQSKNIG